MKKSLFGLTLALAGVVGILPVSTQAGGIAACREATPDLSEDSLLISGNFKYCKNPSAWLGQTDGSYTKLVATLVNKDNVLATLTDTAVVVGSTQNVVVKCGWSARCAIDVAFLEDCDPCEEGLPAPVARTGQTFCTYYDGGWVYDNECSQVPRPAGQDGDLQKGVAWPNPRFTDNGNGTVTDNLTGLIWLKNANCFGLRDWTTAMNDANTLNSGECDLTDDSAEGDWRLPNIRELQSLVDFGYTYPALPNTAGTGQWTEGDPFLGIETGGSYYWSSTNIDRADFAIYLALGRAGIGADYKGNVLAVVWPVRGGQ